MKMTIGPLPNVLVALFYWMHVGDVQNAGTHVLKAPHPNGNHVWCGSVVFNVSIILSWSKKLKPLKTVKACPDVI